MMTTDQKIDLFFRNPAEEPDGSIQGVLYLLRREVQDCFIGKVVPEDQVIAESQKDRHRLFATVMVIMAGIDLLAKFYAGSDENGGVGSRIRTFAREFVFADLPSAQLFSEVLYEGCRNPMLHSFALQNKRFRMTLMQGFSHGVLRRVKGQPDWFVLSVEGLYVAFVRAVKAYEVQVRTNPQTQEKFVRMFEDYGSIGMQSYHVEPVSA
jgi:hypothetical protein